MRLLDELGIPESAYGKPDGQARTVCCDFREHFITPFVGHIQVAGTLHGINLRARRVRNRKVRKEEMAYQLLAVAAQ